MINWYKKLYIGDNAKKREKKIIWRVNHRRPQKDVYLVTLASNPENVLDIFPANMLLQKPLAFLCPTIVGIAVGYGEAAELVRRLVDETYRRQGNADVRRYLKARLEEGSGKRTGG